jgi:hypothetical protein
MARLSRAPRSAQCGRAVSIHEAAPPGFAGAGCGADCGGAVLVQRQVHLHSVSSRADWTRPRSWRPWREAVCLRVLGSHYAHAGEVASALAARLAAVIHRPSTTAPSRPPLAEGWLFNWHDIRR